MSSYIYSYSFTYLAVVANFVYLIYFAWPNASLLERVLLNKSINFDSMLKFSLAISYINYLSLIVLSFTFKHFDGDTCGEANLSVFNICFDSEFFDV